MTDNTPQLQPCPVCGTTPEYIEDYSGTVTVRCPHCEYQSETDFDVWNTLTTENLTPRTCPACQQKPHAVLSNDMYEGKVQFHLSCEDHSAPWCENPQWAIIQWNLVTPAANQWQPTLQQLAAYGISVKPVEHDDRQ